MTTGQPWRMRVWLPLVAGLAIVFALVIPWLPSLAPTERPVIAGERVPANTASFEPATGWTLDLEAATGSRPEVTHAGVTVRLSDGVWFGNTSDLLERLAEQLRAAGADVGALPDAPTDDGLLTVSVDPTAPAVIPRAEYVVEFTMGDNNGRLLVVREDVLVALLRTVGAADDVAAQTAAVSAMEASIETGVLDVVDVPTVAR